MAPPDAAAIAAVTLHQPWASLIAAGAKPYETRGWAPPKALIGGRLAIHAGMRVVRRLPDDIAEAVARALGPDWSERVPRGAVLGFATLGGAWRVAGPQDAATGILPIDVSAEGSKPQPAIRPDPFGDYGPGRWLWALDGFTAFEPPAPAKGLQRVWRWRPSTT